MLYQNVLTLTNIKVLKQWTVPDLEKYILGSLATQAHDSQFEELEKVRELKKAWSYTTCLVSDFVHFINNEILRHPTS